MKVHVGVFAYNEQNRIAEVLADLVRQDLFERPGGRPRKDIEVAPACLSLWERLIVMASGPASDYRTVISGQLYLMRTSALDGIFVPVHFLVKCLQNLGMPRARGVGRVAVLAGVGFAFDAVNARVQMTREKGAYW